MVNKVKVQFTTVEPFGVQLAIIKGDSISDCKSYLKRYKSTIKGTEKNKHCNGFYWRFTGDNKKEYCSILLTNDIPDNEIHGVIAHESFHAIMDIADSRGCYWNSGSNEWYAYALDRLIRDITVFYTKD